MVDIHIGFEVPVDVTPSTGDPPDADQFYHALGTAMVAWGGSKATSLAACC